MKTANPKLSFTRDYIADLNPQGAVELQLARTLAMDNWRLNRIKAVEENIFAWGHAVEHADVCTSEIPQVENAMIHAVSYLQYADRIDKISLYESPPQPPSSPETSTCSKSARPNAEKTNPANPNRLHPPSPIKSITYRQKWLRSKGFSNRPHTEVPKAA